MKVKPQFSKVSPEIKLLCCILLPLLCFTYMGVPYATVAALFTTVVVLWLSELIPLASTALLIPVLATVYNIATPKEIFSAFGNQILFLFIGAFLLAEAMHKHDWDRRMAYFVLKQKYIASPARLLNCIALICWILSMWISNTAACAIMMPICLGVISSLKGSIDEVELKTLSTRMLLICAFASSIGGMSTPVGSPPNALAIELLSTKGIEIGFLTWMSYGVPISICMLFILKTTLAMLYPLSSANLSSLREHFSREYKKLGRIKRAELQVFSCFALAVTLWLLPSILTRIFDDSQILLIAKQQLSMGTVALLATIPLFALRQSNEANCERTLSWEDAKKIDWGTIILFGGGLCLGSILNSSGLAQALAEELLKLNSSSAVIICAIIVLASILMSEFSSNTASASVIIPIVLSLDYTQFNVSNTSLVLAAAFGTSFGFMLPVSTPPNAIVFGTGKIKLREMIKAGLSFDILGMICILIFMVYIYS